VKEKRTKAKDEQLEDTLRDEYDFSGAVRGKYHAKYIESSNVVVLALTLPLLSEMRRQ
jgi:hypothetical protein